MWGENSCTKRTNPLIDNSRDNVPIYMQPTLAKQLTKTRTYVASRRAHTRAEGGQVQAVVRSSYNLTLIPEFGPGGSPNAVSTPMLVRKSFNSLSASNC